MDKLLTLFKRFTKIQSPLKWYLNKEISKKLTISFITLAVISNVLIGTVGIINLENMQKQSQTTYQQDLAPLTPLYKIDSDFLSLQNAADDMDAVGVQNYNNDIMAQLKIYSNMANSKSDKSSLVTLVGNLSIVMGNEQIIMDSYLMGNTKEALALKNGDAAKSLTDFENTVNQLFVSKTNDAQQNNQRENTTFIVTLIFTIFIILLSIGVSIAFALMNARILSKPIKKLVKSANEIADGNLDVDVSVDTGDEISYLASSFAKITESLKMLKDDVALLIDGAVEGKLDIRADITKHNGAFREIIDGVNKSLDAITLPLNTAAEYLDDISRGEIPEKISDDFKGDFNKIKLNLNTCIDSVNNLVSDANMLSVSAIAGDLSVRADATHHNGDFKKIIVGVNNTLDAVIIPFNMAASYIDRISHGDMPEEINDDMQGDFNIIKDNLNICTVAIKQLISDAKMLSEAAVAGDLSVRADTTMHQGDFKKIIEGVNDTLDSVIGPMTVAADCVGRISRGDIPEKITMQANGEFKSFVDSLNECIDAINRLVEDANMLANAADEGQLSVRADSQRHQGDFKKIIEGLNNTFESMVMPVNEAEQVLSELAKGNLGKNVEGEYKGDLAIIKESINATTGAWSGYISEISTVLAEMSSGNFQTQLTADFKGDFAEIKESINNIIDKLGAVIRQIIISADEIGESSKQVSEGSRDLSLGSSDQAASIEELNAAILQIAQKTSENAENANKANKIAAKVKQDAEGGNQQMEQMLISMSEINESAGSISKIIKVIDSIAFQTNILALNAAVEAARAGSYGKGFAVVAQEVRTLAGRSAAAANDTSVMIDKSISKASEGTITAQDTSEALKKIENGVNSTAELIADIAVSSKEQASGINEINNAINQVSKIVQSNSATSQESAAASEELFGQAEKLRELVSRFKVKED